MSTLVPDDLIKDQAALVALERTALSRSDGHFTIMRFTTNWRVCLGTPESRDDITDMTEGETLMDAVRNLLYTEEQSRGHA